MSQSSYKNCSISELNHKNEETIHQLINPVRRVLIIVIDIRFNTEAVRHDKLRTNWWMLPVALVNEGLQKNYDDRWA